MSVALEVSGITKRFDDLTAVDDVSFEVRRGEIYGFIGPNGAGKTTTMRICSTLELPDSGDVRIDGQSVLEAPREARRKLGFMPDNYGAYRHTTVYDYLDFFARAYGLRGKRRTHTVQEVMDFTSLHGLAQKETTALSKGMKQRLCLAKTMLHDPALLILDEPAAGLDPRARIELRELVKALADMDKALLISSHILSELAEVCHGVAIIERGRIRGKGSVDEMQRGLQRHTTVFVRTIAPLEQTERFLLEQPHVGSIRPLRNGLALDFTGDETQLSVLFAALGASDLKPIEFASEVADLEDIFMSLTEGVVQ